MGMYKKEQMEKEENEEKFCCESCNGNFPISQLCERNGMKYCPDCAKEWDNKEKE